MAQRIWKSPGVAREIGCSYTQLVSLMRYGKLVPPSKDDSGDFIWFPADVERARKALQEHRRAKLEGGEA